MSTTDNDSRDAYSNQIPKHVSLQFGRMSLLAVTLNLVLTWSLVLLSPGTSSEIPVLLAVSRTRYPVLLLSDLICLVSSTCHFLLRLFGGLPVTRPDVKFFCDLDYDPFLVMQDGNKMYGTCIRVCIQVPI